MTVISEAKPYLKNEERYSLNSIFENGYQVNYSGMGISSNQMFKNIKWAQRANPIFDPKKLSFILGQETIFATNSQEWPYGVKKYLLSKQKNEMPATQYFQLPKDRVVEVGTQVAL